VKESVIDYWLVAARPADQRASQPGLRGFSGMLFEELGERVALSLYDRVTLRTQSNRVAHVGGARSSVRHSRDQAEVKIVGGGELEVQHSLRPGEVTVLGQLTVRLPREPEPVTLVVLARERA
jgi:hypothetical protein